MYTIKEQIQIIIYFLIFGIFSISMYRIFCYFIERIKLKKIIKYIFELIFWIFLIYVSCKYLLSSTKGYIPFYGIIFFVLGIVLYFYLLDKKMYKNLDIVSCYIGKIFSEVLYSKEEVIIVKSLINRIRRKKNEKSINTNDDTL